MSQRQISVFSEWSTRSRDHGRLSVRRNLSSDAGWYEDAIGTAWLGAVVVLVLLTNRLRQAANVV